MLTLLYRRLRRVGLILGELGVVSFQRAGGENLLDLLSKRNEIHKYTRNHWSVRDLLSKRPFGTMPAWTLTHRKLL
jgi:hypothetical protein